MEMRSGNMTMGWIYLALAVFAATVLLYPSAPFAQEPTEPGHQSEQPLPDAKIIEHQSLLEFESARRLHDESVLIARLVQKDTEIAVLRKKVAELEAAKTKPEPPGRDGH